MTRRRSARASAAGITALASALVVAPAARAQTSPAPVAQATPTDPNAPRVAGRDVAVPNRRKYVAPEYPPEAAAAGTRGIVIMEVLIGEDGRVENARVTRSIAGLDDAAVAAVKMWEYEVTRVGGKPVKVLLSQSITFALRLPEIQREPGIPELRSGGTPPVPTSLNMNESAALQVTIGAQGEVKEAAQTAGSSVLGEALLRAVKLWRFAVAEGASEMTFILQGDWKPGANPPLSLKATSPKFGGLAAASAPSSTPPAASAPLAQTSATPAITPPGGAPTAAAAPTPTSPDAETEVIPARPEPPTKEEGTSAVTDVILGENIPDLVRGRRPVWPPLARLGNIIGQVVVRFSVDLAGRVTVHSAERHEILKSAAEQAVGTWVFRRTAIDRLNLIATFSYGQERTNAKIERAKE
jgi:TonB family protein